ncbi:MAG: NADH-quinone oxidoreductase subunit L [Chloroflexi bacterium]|jgi:NADH-quinone oxidoreductase subunit L|nr:MAG: NADH-quinone oxidoreductase subunit L [Chloroflexota bacterium]
MINEFFAWAILFLPLASFSIIAILCLAFRALDARVSSYLAILTIGATFALSVAALAGTASHGEFKWDSHTWLSIGDLEIKIGILMDSLTSIMLVVATGVSLLVQIYSLGYMERHEYPRYYAYMSLFTASMVGVVLAKSILQVYFFWELVGLSSYLLIGFWYHKPSAAAAAKKAFLITRIGDVGFLLAILYLFAQKQFYIDQGLNPFEIPDILGSASALPVFAATWLSLGIFAGAVGKSAQFPLHTWLPDAMEGPTPVSALIHAATMVAAGVFLIVRLFGLIEQSEMALAVVALTGAFTAVFAATMGMVMNDIKRVLAYSTISQLGYMVAAVGIGVPAVAMFHLFTHAFFKALLFLGSGSVNHATGTFDMRYMGGLRKHMKWTYYTFLIGSLSLVGIFPLAGFWSKDEILLDAFRGGDTIDQIVFALTFTGIFLTAFYMFRCIHMTFHGEFRGGADAENGEIGKSVHLAESPLVMVAPLVILAVAAIGSGYVANPLDKLGAIPAHWFVEFLGGHGGKFSIQLALASTLVAVLGIGIATLLHRNSQLRKVGVLATLKPLEGIISRKYYLDDFYEGLVVSKIFYGGVARFLDWFDREIVDRTVEIIGFIGRNSGRVFTPLQNGQVQVYGLVASLGGLLIMVAYLVFG